MKTKPKIPKDSIDFNYYAAKKMNRIIQKVVRVIVVVGVALILSLIFTWLLTLNIL